MDGPRAKLDGRMYECPRGGLSELLACGTILTNAMDKTYARFISMPLRDFRLLVFRSSSRLFEVVGAGGLAASKEIFTSCETLSAVTELGTMYQVCVSAR